MGSRVKVVRVAQDAEWKKDSLIYVFLSRPPIDRTWVIELFSINSIWNYNFSSTLPNEDRIVELFSFVFPCLQLAPTPQLFLFLLSLMLMKWRQI